MRVSHQWLCELIPGLDRTPSEIGDRLTRIGLELEGLESFGAGLEQIELVRVERVEPHPSRDKLQLVTIARKASEEQVVCGASNVPAPGGLVALAPLGSYLPAIDLKLEPKSLGGVVSKGMLCSEIELGLGSDANGILTFEPGRFAPGTPFLEAFPFAKDTLYELGVTPNRPDALGHRGVARDLATALGLEWKAPAPSPTASITAAPGTVDEFVRIENLAPERCPRYGAAIVRGVTVRPSPEWLRWRLHALGVRPISNVVDITNLLLLEYGNPMHAFDLARIQQRKIVVRLARPDEKMTTLDGSERALLESDLVIGDGENASALAGIMGGAQSEIRSDTKDVLLECAYFAPQGIRRTSRRLALHTESSFRFERGVDWSALDSVLARASHLLCELGGGQAVPGLRFADGKSPELATIPLRQSQLERVLGCAVDFDAALTTLGRLGFAVLKREGAEATLRGAPWRPDVELEADLIEEVARTLGLDNLPTVLPRVAPRSPTVAGRLERRVRGVASALGLSEAITYSFVSPARLTAVHAPPSSVTLSNPLSSDRSVLTTSLLPGLLEALARAQRHGEADVRLFTVASRFLPSPQAPLPATTQAARPRALDDGELPEERASFAAVLGGTRPTYLKSPEPLDPFDGKGLAERLLQSLTGQRPTVEWAGAAPSPVPHLHPRGAGQLLLGGAVVGAFGPLHPDVAERFELSGPVQIVELDLAALETLVGTVPRYRPIPRLPAVSRDIALEVPESTPARSLEQAIRESAGALCESVTLFDLFQGAPLEPGRRSLAFRLIYRDPEAALNPEQAKTLTDKQVDQRQELVVEAVRKLGAVVRA